MPNQFLTLVIMAAGLGTRYGGNKQLEGFGPQGETLMEYSIYDAIKAGFKKVVFIVRPEIHQEVQNTIVTKIKNKIDVAIVHQTLESLVPEGLRNPRRTKPYGTAHAVLCARDEVKDNFAVINADDFYGRDALHTVADFLKKSNNISHCLVGYKLSLVLSKHGTVSRAVCQVDKEGNLKGIKETHQISEENGKITAGQDGRRVELSPSERISMNLWGFGQQFFHIADILFRQFLLEKYSDIKGEFYIADVANQIMMEDKSKIKVLPTDAAWTGVTYQEDKEVVEQRLKDLTLTGEYPEKLW